MRKIVNYIKLDSRYDKYMFKGVSLMDVQIFVNQIKIPKEKIMIYQDISQISENLQAPLYKVKHVNSIKKRTNRFYTGNDCLIVTNKKNIDLLKKSCNEIFYTDDEICIPTEVLLILYIHDIDWQAIIIFNDIELKNEFLSFLKRNSKLIFEPNVDVFYD